MAARQPHGACVEELLQLPDDAKDTDFFMLIDVIQITDRHDPLGGNLVVVGCDALRNARLAELVGSIGPDTGELPQAFIGRRRDLLVLFFSSEEQIIDLLHQRIS